MKNKNTNQINIFRIINLLEAVQLEGKEFYIEGEKITDPKNKIKFTSAESEFILTNKNILKDYGFSSLLKAFEDRENNNKIEIIPKRTDKPLSDEQKFKNYFELYSKLSNKPLNPAQITSLYSLCHQEGNHKNSIEKATKLLSTFPDFLQSFSYTIPKKNNDHWYEIVLLHRESAVRLLAEINEIEKALGENGHNRSPKNLNDALIGWAEVHSPGFKDFIDKQPPDKAAILINFVSQCLKNGVENQTVNGEYKEDFSRALEFAYSSIDRGSKPAIPDIIIEGKDLDKQLEKYYIMALRRNDPRGYIVGAMTGCCQHIGNPSGEHLAIGSMEQDDTGVYVICKKKNANDPINHYSDEIVGQSYTWIGHAKDGKKGVCFDSFEARDKNSLTKKLCVTFFSKLATRLAETNKNIERVTMGIGYTKSAPDIFPETDTHVRLLSSSYQYDDDSEHQRIILDKKSKIDPSQPEWELKRGIYTEDMFVPAKLEEFKQFLANHSNAISYETLMDTFSIVCKKKLEGFQAVILEQLQAKDSSKLKQDSSIFSLGVTALDQGSLESFQLIKQYIDIDAFNKHLINKDDVSIAKINYLKHHVKDEQTTNAFITSIFTKLSSPQKFSSELVECIQAYPEKIKKNIDPKIINKIFSSAINNGDKQLVQAIVGLQSNSTSKIKHILTPYLDRALTKEAKKNLLVAPVKGGSSRS